MLRSPAGNWDNEGCFVYVALSSIVARKCKNVGDDFKTEFLVNEGELVATNLIQHSRIHGSKNGPFLTVATNDNGYESIGYIFVHKHGKEVMRQVPVKDGLWGFYVNNYPVGIALRQHPIDKANVKIPGKAFLPMEKIYCDKKVKSDNGVNFYRVQGTNGWVFDRRIASDGSIHFMLTPSSKVTTGLFTFKSLETISIRSNIDVDDKCKTMRRVLPNDLVAADIILENPCGLHNNNGPFVRLTDGSGWLFERKNNARILQRIPVESGKWLFEVVHSVGIALRRQPIDRQNNFIPGVIYEYGKRVWCDRKIESPSGVCFYRVKKTDGWIFDKRDGKTMLELVPTLQLDFEESTASLHNGPWSPDMVRKIASQVHGVEEIAFIPESRVISFRTINSEVRINVYYTTRTVGTAMDHPVQGKTQLFRRNCSQYELLDIFRNPRTHTGRGYKTQQMSTSAESIRASNDFEPSREEEVSLRMTLKAFDEELDAIKEKKLELLKIIDTFDTKQQSEAEKSEKKRLASKKEIEEIIQKKKEDEERRRQEEEQRRQRTCDICQREFVNTHAKNQHYQDVHLYKCGFCGNSFESYNALRQHKDAKGHW